MNTSAKGRRNEHRSIALYEARGYVCVRSAGSRGLWDFIAIGPNDLIVVQVKSTHWPYPSERGALELFSSPLNVRRVMHRWRPRAKLPDVRSWSTGEWLDDEGHWT